MEPLPHLFTLLTTAVTLLAVLFFYLAGARSVLLLVFIGGWMTITAFLAAYGFYADFGAVPPRLFTVLGPMVLLILFLCLHPKGRHLLRSLDPAWLTLLHSVRIPVELGLYFLFLHKGVPELMTFEGFNFDILSGITAPVMYLLVFRLRILGRRSLLVWNVLCLGLLFNILGLAVLSIPTPFQQLAFDQPNVAVAHFPAVWLPAVIVPLVMVSHLAVLLGAGGGTKQPA